MLRRPVQAIIFFTQLTVIPRCVSADICMHSTPETGKGMGDGEGAGTTGDGGKAVEETLPSNKLKASKTNPGPLPEYSNPIELHPQQ